VHWNIASIEVASSAADI